MRGVMWTLHADDRAPAVTVYDRPLNNEIQAAIGCELMQLVPAFSTLQLPEAFAEGEAAPVLREAVGKPIDVVVFCDEEGKLNGLPLNHNATVLWARAMQRAGFPVTETEDGRLGMPDVLVGSVVFIWGDDEFMETL